MTRHERDGLGGGGAGGAVLGERGGCDGERDERMSACGHVTHLVTSEARRFGLHLGDDTWWPCYVYDTSSRPASAPVSDGEASGDDGVGSGSVDGSEGATGR